MELFRSRRRDSKLAANNDGCKGRHVLLAPTEQLALVLSPASRERCPNFNIDKQLQFLKYFFSNMRMTINTDKTKVMIIESKKINYAIFL